MARVYVIKIGEAVLGRNNLFDILIWLHKTNENSIKEHLHNGKRNKISVYKLILCCLSGDGHTKPKPRRGNLPEPTEYKCLIRATLGNKKLSTVVSIEL